MCVNISVADIRLVYYLVKTALVDVDGHADRNDRVHVGRGGGGVSIL